MTPSAFNRMSRRNAFREAGVGINTPLDSRGRVALHLAAAEGDVEAIDSLTRAGAHINQKDYAGKTPLFEAISRSDAAMVEFLLDRGATFRIVDDDQNTPLIWAIEHGCSAAFVERLVELGAKPDAVTEDGRTLIHAAARAGRADVLEYLVSLDLPVDAQNEKGQTAVHIAVAAGATEVLETLFALGADPNIRDSAIKTPLHAAVEKNDMAMVDILLSHPEVRRRINEFKTFNEGFTPLHAAVLRNNEALVEKLVDVGANVNIEDNQSRHSLFLAVEKGKPAMARLLIRLGANVESAPVYNADGSGMIHWIGNDHYREMLALLCAAGVDVSAGDNYGSTPLHRACERDEKDKIRVLLDMGADPNRATQNGQRPIDIMMSQLYYSDETEILEKLLEKGADPNISATGQSVYSPLHLASWRGHMKKMALLLKAGANPDEPLRDTHNYGMTPLLKAAETGHIAAVVLLANSGADPLKTDKFGCNGLHLSSSSGNKELIEYFLGLPGVAIDAQDLNGLTPLHYACRPERASPEIVSLLLGKGADPAVADKNGQTPLHYAAQIYYSSYSGALTAFESAPQGKVDWNVRVSGSQETPLHFAVKKGCKKDVEYLLSKGADQVLADKNGVTPLHQAILTDQGEMAVALLQDLDGRKIPVDSLKDAQGCTPLHYAAACEKEMNSAILIQAGADINARTDDGDTPLHIAVKMQQIKIINFLMKKGADASLKNKAGLSPRTIAEALGMTNLDSEPKKTAAPQPRQPGP